ncbi:YtxH domain-containing protein [Mucilaginibacter sp.]|uniref:YtxH domain-containing protein n=1 Tax=Mucilaginibacter sp. TaxID=1882438 RepID=UPI00283D4975|nr:YtxH domain-containing protein [Mucilaginibacter sp.]MDR3693603.1 YtxH domain-containing protein [Mucilaginibacter sp.]
MKDQTRVIAALLIGAAAGAALGLLLAPEKGENIRDGIADYINDLVDAAKDKAQAASKDIKQYSGTVYDKAKTKLNNAVNDLNEYRDVAIETARTKADELKEQAQSKFNEGKARVKNGSDEVNNAIQNS